VYYLAGTRFEGAGEFDECAPTSRIVCKLTGGIDGTYAFKFDPAALATTVFFTIVYTVPATLLTTLPQLAFTALCVRHIDCLLANLKTVIPFFVVAPVP
jgi:hypothetical protein